MHSLPNSEECSGVIAILRKCKEVTATLLCVCAQHDRESNIQRKSVK